MTSPIRVALAALAAAAARSARPTAATAALAALLCPLQGLAAQQVEREVQVPLAPDIGIVEVDARLRQELLLFEDVPGFVAARLFRTAAGTHVLEISYREQGAAARERRPLTDAALASLRADLQERLAARGRAQVLDREGRAGFIVGQTAVGLLYHGWALPVVLDIDSDRGRVATYLLTAGASFLVPWLITSEVPMTVAQRDASFWGATRGVAYGNVLGGALRPRSSRLEPWQDDPAATRTRFAVGSAVSVLGSFLGYHAARYSGHDPGTVALWSAAGDFGLAGAFGTSYALGLYRGEEVCDPFGCRRDDFRSTRRGHAATLALGLASLYGARAWGEAERYTGGDATALRSFGILGAQALLPLAVEIFEDRDEGGRGIAASAVLGGAAALYLGNRALRGTSLTEGEGLLVLAGHLAGGLAALGITYLADTGERGDATLYLTTSAVGSMIGSLLTFRAVRF